MTLDELIKRVPQETEDRVEKTRQRFNGVIRTILRDEMALRLSLAPSDGSDAASREAVSIPVRVVAGAPLSDNKSITIKDIDALAILLGQHRSSLEALAASARALQPLFKALNDRQFASEDPVPVEEIERSETWANGLLNRLKKADPLKGILNFREDVLGRYVYRLPVFEKWRNRWTADPFKGEIALYWGVIGLVAELLNATPEDLTVVVLAHELAHAYTHIGADIDGARWASREFAGADVEFKEGLAQYYTMRVCNRLEGRVPGAILAFNGLLPRQPEPYHVQTAWIKSRSSPEHVRIAMIEARRKGIGKVPEFEALLESARGRLVVRTLPDSSSS